MTGDDLLTWLQSLTPEQRTFDMCVTSASGPVVFGDPAEFFQITGKFVVGQELGKFDKSAFGILDEGSPVLIFDE